MCTALKLRHLSFTHHGPAHWVIAEVMRVHWTKLESVLSQSPYLSLCFHLNGHSVTKKLNGFSSVPYQKASTKFCKTLQKKMKISTTVLSPKSSTSKKKFCLLYDNQDPESNYLLFTVKPHNKH